ncbi:MAG TPA: hypothetical protein VMZ91_07145 [Candidatus Paceibacterota bacterium]|nr:hypothetical protein [Candidatus Paceibacterota bacterium]
MIEEYKCIKYNEKSDDCFLCDGYGRSEHIETDDCYVNKLEGTLVKFPCNRIIGDEEQ